MSARRLFLTFQNSLAMPTSKHGHTASKGRASEEFSVLWARLTSRARIETSIRHSRRGEEIEQITLNGLFGHGIPEDYVLHG